MPASPRLVSGRFDPTRQRAVWPSTGNYCRGGVAISKIIGCRGVAVLPAGMSAERFEWLERWVAEPGDIVRTPGTESNVKEIYDACAELARDPANEIVNQFSGLGITVSTTSSKTSATIIDSTSSLKNVLAISEKHDDDHDDDH